GASHEPKTIPIDCHIRLSVAVVVRWHRYVLCHPAPAHRCDTAIRGAKNIPHTIPINCNIRLSVSVVVTWHRNVLCHPSPAYRCDTAIRGAKNKPHTISINRNVCFPVSVVITWHRNVPRHSKHKTGINPASVRATVAVIEIPSPNARAKNTDPRDRSGHRSSGSTSLNRISRIT